MNILFTAFSIIYFCYVVFEIIQLLFKYEYSFEELKEMIFQIEYRIERNNLVNDNLDLRKDKLLPKRGYFERKIVLFKIPFLKTTFKPKYKNNKLYMNLFEEYFQRLNEYRKMALIFILGIFILVFIRFMLIFN